MSALGQKRTFRALNAAMSAMPPTADMYQSTLMSAMCHKPTSSGYRIGYVRYWHILARS